jgi:glyoxylase-like metal-dependent hydrolase (beta-lactamase superfamily II)
MAIIHTLRLPLPLRTGTVNSYLLETKTGFLLIDTGASSARGALQHTLERIGVEPGRLRLIVITHGDFDHTGNAAFLRSQYQAQIAMHAGDLGMAVRGDMFFGRKVGNGLIRVIAPLFFGFGKAERFQPDALLEDGCPLAPYGLAARVVNIPGHSAGSIGVLTEQGELFCGDLLENTTRPALNSIMDDLQAAKASVARLRSLPVQMVYPGHGGPFSLGDLHG